MVKADIGPRAATWGGSADLHAMLVNIEYYLSLLVWRHTEAAKTGSNMPTRRKPPIEGEQKPKPTMELDPEPGEDTHVIGGTGVDRATMARLLGWEPPPPGSE